MALFRRFAVPVALIAAFAALFIFTRPEDAVPEMPPSLASRAATEREALRGAKVSSDFRLRDAQPESGIAFFPETPDYHAFYDHGNGLAVADVEGDGDPDLYFTAQVGGNKLFLNRGDGTFEDGTERSGTALRNKVNISPAFADIDNDGDPDLFVTSVRTGNSLLLNRGDGTFEDISRAAGVDHVGHSSAPVFFDFDRDGLLDLFVAQAGSYTTEERESVAGTEYFRDRMDANLGEAEPGLFYHNLGGGKFREEAAKLGLAYSGWTPEAAAGDLNGDAWPDLYVANMVGEDFYFENQGGRGFMEKTAEFFPKTPYGTVGVKLFDWNNDGALDVYAVDMHSDMTQPQEEWQEKMKTDPRHMHKDPGAYLFGNAFFESSGGAFQEISDAVGAETYWPWGPATGDLNADGWQDVFVSAGMGYPFRYGVNTLLLSEEGEIFRDATFASGVEPRREGRMEMPWGVRDCASDRDRRTRECRNATGTVPYRGTLSTRGVAIFDLENDGDLDVVTNELKAAPQVLRNDLSARHEVNYLSLHLEGTRSNRDAIGAEVIARMPGGRQITAFRDGRSGYLSSTLAPLYLGLGDAWEAEEIEVHWPSGTVQTITEGDLRGELTLQEPL